MKRIKHYAVGSAIGAARRTWSVVPAAISLYMVSACGYCGQVTIKAADRVVLSEPRIAISYTVDRGSLGRYLAYQPIEINAGGAGLDLANFRCYGTWPSQANVVSQDDHGVNINFARDQVTLRSTIGCAATRAEIPLGASYNDVMTVRTGTSLTGRNTIDGSEITIQITDAIIYDRLNNAVSSYNNGVATASTTSLAVTRTGPGITATYVDAVKNQQTVGGGGSTAELVTIVTQNWGGGAAYGVNIRTPTGPLGTYTKPLVNDKPVPWDQQQVLTANSKVGLQISNVPAGNSVAGELVVELAMM